MFRNIYTTRCNTLNAVLKERSETFEIITLTVGMMTIFIKMEVENVMSSSVDTKDLAESFLRKLNPVGLTLQRIFRLKSHIVGKLTTMPEIGALSLSSDCQEQRWFVH